ncbi:MAG TPA: hypothetical protein VNN25_06810 [Thermoanaerobaculia bacterium]|nr:hypothetical protein [Thermoanaerobaculia bacterium]
MRVGTLASRRLARRRPAAAFCVGLLFLIAAANARAVETVRIAPVINAPAGVVVHGTAELHIAGTSTIRDLDSTVLTTKRIASADREEYSDTTLSRDAAGSRFRRVYGRVIHEEESGNTFGVMNGRSLLFVMKGRNVTVTPDTGPDLTVDETMGLTELAQRALRVESANFCIAPYALTVGASWNVPASLLADCYDELGHVVKTIPGRGTLRAIENQDGHRVAIIELSFVRSIDSMGEIKFDSLADAAVTSKIEITLDQPVKWRRLTLTTLSGVSHPKGLAKPSVTIALQATETVTSAP